ncbi:MAG TPA: peptide chain release factor N(5)-glutamine methyltransferase [Parachlamydiales bacterium]|nr:peptide chain release factor N(5)-glutamine methyltransferase [Parachlamydiales bacterium]
MVGLCSLVNLKRTVFEDRISAGGRMKTVQEVLTLSAAYLKKSGLPSARRVCEELLSSVLNCDRIALYMQFDRPLEEGELTLFRRHFSRALRKEPYEYILGEISFFHCRIEVNPSVLIPRQETEILLEKVCQRVGAARKIAWDLCTGSGCLGIGLKKIRPQLEVSLSDMSECALAVASCNALKNQVEVEICQGDLLEPFLGRRADLILCNPPYVSEAEYRLLAPSVTLFEPKMALVGGKTGLEFYERLSQDASRFLNPGGRLFLEMGATQREPLLKLFSSSFWKSKEIFQDWAGKDRFFFLEAHS